MLTNHLFHRFILVKIYFKVKVASLGMDSFGTNVADRKAVSMQLMTETIYT